MTTEKLLEIVSERGLRIELKQGTPHLIGPKEEATDKLLQVLKLPSHREKIISMLQKQQELFPKESGRKILCQWGNGYVGQKFAEGWPVGARFWRYEDEKNWQLIPREPAQQGYSNHVIQNTPDLKKWVEQTEPKRSA